MKKKSNRRGKIKYPNLDPQYNLKKRRDYLDNKEYIKGVKNHLGEPVIRPLEEEELEFLNKFNGEFYNASFNRDDSDIHKQTIDDDTIADIKMQIKDIKAKIRTITNKSANTTTDEDRKICSVYNEQLQDMEDFLDKAHPRRDCEHRNNHRNTCVVNDAKSQGKLKFVTFAEEKDELIGAVLPEYFKEED